MVLLGELAVVALGFVLALAFHDKAEIVGTHRAWNSPGGRRFSTRIRERFPRRPGSCSDCGYYWGRWWEPYFTAYMLSIYFVLWCVLVVIGYAIRGRIERRRAAAA